MTRLTAELDQKNVAHVLVSDPQAGTERMYAALQIPELPGWIAVLLLEKKNGVPNLVEWRVVAGNIDSMITKRDSTHSLGLKTSSPPETEVITATLLRKVPIERLVRLAQQGLPTKIAELPWREWASIDPSRPGRPGRSDIEYAQMAEMYVRIWDSGVPNTTEHLAEQVSLSPTQVRNILGQARKRGLLTPAPRGKAGGELTDLAIEMLKEHAAAAEEDN
jgi:hypothetical protein